MSGEVSPSTSPAKSSSIMRSTAEAGPQRHALSFGYLTAERFGMDGTKQHYLPVGRSDYLPRSPVSPREMTRSSRFGPLPVPSTVN